jgi:FAD/FMN-containing dehydrogenase
MRLELGDDVVDLMRDIKRVFDPENLMNPGKVVPS